MSNRRRIACLSAFGAALAMACGPQRLTGPTRPGDEVVLLLPDADTGITGRAVVSNPAGSAELDDPREGARVSPNQAPGPVGRMSQNDVDRLFGDALKSLPPAPRHFTLNFRFESDELTEHSRALVPEILKTDKSRVVPDVVVVGHTDTSGSADAILELGLMVAVMVRTLLVDAGLVPQSIEVTSHVEADLLI
jgi:outer membrane protein OmpA-like peptidoglycan-associated protein